MTTTPGPSIWNRINTCPEHWTSLLTSIQAPSRFPLQWSFDHLRLAQSSPNAQTPLTFQDVLRIVLNKIRVSPPQSLCEQVKRISKILAAVSEIPGSEFDLVDLDTKKAYMYLRLVDCLVKEDMMTLASLVLQTQLESLQTRSTQTVCHLRIASLYLDLDNPSQAMIWIGIAFQGSTEHAATQREVELALARFNFQTFKFPQAFRAFNDLMPKLTYQPTRDQIISMRSLSVLLSPPHLRKTFLLEVEKDIKEFGNPSMKLIYAKIVINRPIFKDTKSFRALVSLLPTNPSSQSLLVQIIREHNLWEFSLLSKNVDSNYLIRILDIDTTTISSSQAKEFVELMIKRGRLNATIITSPSDPVYRVKFERSEGSLEDQSAADRGVKMINKMIIVNSQSSPMVIQTAQNEAPPRSSQANLMDSKKRQRSEISEPSPNDSYSSSELSELSDSDQATDDEDWRPETAGPPSPSISTDVQDSSDSDSEGESNPTLRGIFERKGVWQKLCDTSATRLEAKGAWKATLQYRLKTRKVAGKRDRYLAKLPAYLDFFKSCKPLSGWPITGLKVAMFQQHHPSGDKDVSYKVRAFDMARKATESMFVKIFPGLERCRLLDSKLYALHSGIMFPHAPASVTAPSSSTRTSDRANKRRRKKSGSRCDRLDTEAKVGEGSFEFGVQHTRIAAQGFLDFDHDMKTDAVSSTTRHSSSLRNVYHHEKSSLGYEEEEEEERYEEEIGNPPAGSPPALENHMVHGMDEDEEPEPGLEPIFQRDDSSQDLGIGSSKMGSDWQSSSQEMGTDRLEEGSSQLEHRFDMEDDDHGEDEGEVGVDGAFDGLVSGSTSSERIGESDTSRSRSVNRQGSENQNDEGLVNQDENDCSSGDDSEYHVDERRFIDALQDFAKAMRAYANI